MNTEQDLYCRLYVNEADEMLLLGQVTKIIEGVTQGGSVFNDVIDLSWSRNSCESIEGQPEFLCYPSTFEVCPRSEFTGLAKDGESQDYLRYLIKVIISLRWSGYEVVASCGYEDLIAAKTGWNWSVETPNHPVT